MYAPYTAQFIETFCTHCESFSDTGRGHLDDPHNRILGLFALRVYALYQQKTSIIVVLGVIIVAGRAQFIVSYLFPGSPYCY